MNALSVAGVYAVIMRAWDYNSRRLERLKQHVKSDRRLLREWKKRDDFGPDDHAVRKLERTLRFEERSVRRIRYKLGTLRYLKERIERFLRGVKSKGIDQGTIAAHWPAWMDEEGRAKKAVMVWRSS